MILSDWGFDRDGEYYLVPNLLRGTCDRAPQDALKCVFDFSDTFLPSGLFKRLLCLFVAYSGNQRKKYGDMIAEPELYENAGLIALEPAFVLQLREESEKIIIYIDDESLSSKCLALSRSMFLRLHSDTMNGGLSWSILLENTKSGMLQRYEEAQKMQLKPWFEDGVAMETSRSSVDLDQFVERDFHT